MLTIKSSYTGQTLLCLELEDGVLSLPPEQVRAILEDVGDSRIGGHVLVRLSPGTRAAPLSCFLGGAAIDNNTVWDGEKYRHSDDNVSSDFTPL